MALRDTDWAVAQYEAVRALLPQAKMPEQANRAAHLEEIADQFDVFILDAFGVLNIGETAIPGAPERVRTLRQMGKHLRVLTNGATHPAQVSHQKFAALGFDFRLEEIVSSRDALNEALKARPETGTWGAMAAAGSQLESLAVPCAPLGFDRADYDAACGFLMLSTAEWTEAQQALLHDSLAANPRPVMVGNPDIVAPREEGLTLEPGYHAYELMRQLNIRPQFFGKPFGAVYDLAMTGPPKVDPTRVLVVGDTLHTDILGGAARGYRTALVTDHGLFSGMNTAPYVAQTGIVPDYIVPTT
ncbi:MAG: HAD hydrolase-like protein [Paracoccaceae bacterium]|nr:HAD hydrolase-like protein [Paracoccaceae bacterium]